MFDVGGTKVWFIDAVLSKTTPEGSEEKIVGALGCLGHQNI